MIRAASLLGPLDSAELRRLVAPIRPEDVTVRLLPSWAARLWPGWVGAMTMPWGIYLRAELLAGDDDRLRRTLAHELVHARQWKTMGVVSFLLRYVSDYVGNRLRGLGHREAYMAISLEAEAYRLAGSL